MILAWVQSFVAGGTHAGVIGSRPDFERSEPAIRTDKCYRNACPLLRPKLPSPTRAKGKAPGLIPIEIKKTMKRVLPWVAIAIAAFFLGRHFIYRSPDFPVYHSAAISLLSGRTDLYSDTFAWVPPQIYVYPPLFVLL